MDYLHTVWEAREGASASAGGPSPASCRLAARVLRQRGLRADDPRLTLETPHAPDAIGGMREAVDRLLVALERRERILIHGDYDCDGLTATAILWITLAPLLPEGHVDTYIPNRIDEGYGLGDAGIEHAETSGCDLLVTVDCGIRSVDEAARLRALGIDVIITDHHEPGDEIPDACAVIDLHRQGETYPCPDLAGAGVAWKLSEALVEALDADEHHPANALLRRYRARKGRRMAEARVALAALGTLADQMPLLEENRLIVRRGLEALAGGALPGVQHLLETLKLDPQHLTAEDLVFSVAPKLNAAGRLGEERFALDLLLARSTDLRDQAQALIDLNDRRRELEQHVLRDARRQVRDQTDEPVLIVAGEDWHVGVLGIVAAKLTELYGKAALVLTVDETADADGPEMLKGSGRAPDAVDLLALLEGAKEQLVSFGGHRVAAGLAVERERLEAFRAAIRRSFREQDDGTAAVGTADRLDYDLEVPAACLEAEAVRDLDQLRPFGAGFEEPLLCTRHIRVLGLRVLGRDKRHLRLDLATGGRERISAIAFGSGPLAPLIQPGDTVDLLHHLRMNHWRGRSTPQLMVRDIRIPALGDVRPAAASLPTRAGLRSIWPALAQLVGPKSCRADLATFTAHLAGLLRCPLSENEVKLSIRIYAESGLLSLEALGRDRLLLRRVYPRTKVSLEQSATFRRIREEGGSDL